MTRVMANGYKNVSNEYFNSIKYDNNKREKKIN